MGEVLQIKHLSKHYGGILAVEDVSFEVHPNETVGIIGPNGAGKTTLLSMIAGTQKPSTGQIFLGQVDVLRLRPHQVTRLGIARTYQVPRPFRHLTVEENVRVSALVGESRSPWGHRLVEHVLEITGLAPLAKRPAESLGLLQLKRLELSKALATSPKVLLLDEIGSGLTDEELETLTGLVRNIRETGVTMILVEHIIDFITELSDRIVVLDMGRKVIEGVSEVVVQNPVVIRAYLGQKQEDSAGGSDRVEVKAAVSSADGKNSSAQQSQLMLDIQGLTAGYGHIRALQNVTLQLKAEEVVTVLGLNGAGKSTLCKAVMGLVPAVTGSVKLQGMDITAWPVHRRVKEGRIALCPEGRWVFKMQTVLENLQLAGDVAAGSMSDRMDEVMTLFPELAQRRKQMAGTLSGGQQQMLALGRALMTNPRVLLVDEASLGLTPEVVSRIWQALRVLQKSGLALMVIEQRVNESLEMAQRAYVLDRGRVAFSGQPQQLLEGGEIKKMYFGSH